MQEMFLGRAEWVLSGSLDGWGDPIIAHFDLVVFVHTAQAERLRRFVLAKRNASAPTRSRRAAGGIRRWKILSNGPRDTMTATSPFAACKNITPGLRHCPARCCVSMARGRCRSWSGMSLPLCSLALAHIDAFRPQTCDDGITMG